MTEQEKNSFAKILGSVALLCSAELNEPIIEAYWKYLKTKFADVKEFSKAADKVVENWKIVNTFPPASMFVEYKIDKIDLEIIAQKAWDSVIYAIGEGVGYTKTAEFEDKLIPAVVELCGGFSELATKTHEELSWIKKEFIKTYKAALQGEISIRANEQRALLEDTKTLLITADYPTKTQNQKVLTYKEEQNRATKLIANLADAKRIAG